MREQWNSFKWGKVAPRGIREQQREKAIRTGRKSFIRFNLKESSFPSGEKKQRSRPGNIRGREASEKEGINTISRLPILPSGEGRRGPMDLEGGDNTKKGFRKKGV